VPPEREVVIVAACQRSLSLRRTSANELVVAAVTFSRGKDIESDANGAWSMRSGLELIDGPKTISGLRLVLPGHN
jgi:hypothetical protein